MKGYDNIPQLHLTVLRRMGFDMMAKTPAMYFTSMFPTQNIESDEATWEVENSSMGISPFVAPGAPAPRIGIDGYTSGRAKVAYWKEKAFLDETFLNNLREIGSPATKQRAEVWFGRQLRKLVVRSMRRKEWMCAKAIIDGGFTYTAVGGANFTVDYGRPAANSLTLASDKKWGSGAQRNPVEDIFNVRDTMADLYSINVTNMTMNSQTLRLLITDTQIQTLLSKSNFGNGDLFARPAQVLGSLFGFGTIQILDDMYEMNAWVTSVNGTTIGVDNATDFEVGGKLFAQRSTEQYPTEYRTITAVDKIANTLTIDSAFTNAPVANRDKVVMKRKYISDNVVNFTNPGHEGVPANEFLQAPFGIPSHYGMLTDREEEWDPDGVYLRVQDKGLPVLYNPQNSFTLTVA